MAIQISAEVSAVTKDLLDQEVQATGIKKGRLIEDALLIHLQALKALPSEFIIHPRLVLSEASGKEVLERLAHPSPAPALIKLMKRYGG